MMERNGEKDDYLTSNVSERDFNENQGGYGQRGVSYFSSYENVDVHRLMLSDRARTECYRKAMLENRSLFEGKTVIDVGAGTGILSLFAAEAGARKVYAIEASNVSSIAKNIVKQNNMESVIEVFSCQVEDCILPTTEKVDILISEWMGFYLLHESMLSSVILARDKFLKKSGSMFPCEARLYTCPCNLQEFYKKEIQFWDDVYGYDFSVVKQLALQSKQGSPQIMLVDNSELLSTPELLKCFDLMSVCLEDVKNFQTKCFVSSSCKNVCRGVVLWFDCGFPSPDNQEIVLSTAPNSMSTHWKQTVLILPTEIDLDAGDVIGFDIEFSQSAENSRHYNIKLEVLGDDAEHPVPCNCGSARCSLVQAFLQQQDEMNEADDFVDITVVS